MSFIVCVLFLKSGSSGTGSDKRRQHQHPGGGPMMLGVLQSASEEMQSSDSDRSANTVTSGPHHNSGGHLSGSRQSLRMAMGNPCEMFVDFM